MPKRILIFEQYIQASPEQIYYAFTNASALREWLCDYSSADPRPGGRLYLAWSTGYYTSGEYCALEPGRKAVFSWMGKDDPGRSQVTLTLKRQNGGTHVRLKHSLPSQTAHWWKTSQAIEKGWQDSLDNLASLLETGLDLRLVRRPLLGIAISDFNAEVAQKIGVPCERGMRIDSLDESMGAYAAGLRPNDVVVSLAGQEIASFTDLPAALSGKRAGEVVEVIYYRGAQKISAQMTLSPRPIPELPASPGELAQAARKMFDEIEAEYLSCFKDVSDEEASYRPGEGEWNAKETLAHLILGERYWQNFVAEIVTGQESWADDWGGNLHAQVRATVAAYPSLAEMLEAFQRAICETVAFYAHLPEDFVERKGSYRRVAQSGLEASEHYRTHLSQIQAAISAARG
jgi:uncharacterized protein YndB with AHSA1/START domain